MLPKPSLLRLAIGAVFIATLAMGSAQADTPFRSDQVTVECLLRGTALKDFSGRPLTGNPQLRCSNAMVPETVDIDGKSLALYAYGTGPQPITFYGGSLRVCNRVRFNGTACFTSNPFAGPQVTQSICGYPAPVAIAVSCEFSGCNAEYFSPACASSSPGVQGEQAYGAPASTGNVGGHITDASDFPNQTFATRFDFTGNLNTAASIVRQGRIPILGLGALLFDDLGALRPAAAQDLKLAVQAFPTVFAISPLIIEVADEPFLRADPASLPGRIDAFKKGVALLKQQLPSASLGVVVAPVWSSDPQMIPSIEAILPGLSWLATDPYAFSLDTASMDSALQQAREFAGYLQARHPQLARWMVLQGFAPRASLPPPSWTTAQLLEFQQFIGRLIAIANNQYQGKLVWGWSNGAELTDAYTGKNFAPNLRAFYANALAVPPAAAGSQ